MMPRDGGRRIEQFETEYIIRSGGFGMPMVRDMARESTVFNTPEFTQAIRDLLSELARYIEDYDIS